MTGIRNPYHNAGKGLNFDIPYVSDSGLEPFMNRVTEIDYGLGHAQFNDQSQTMSVQWVAPSESFPFDAANSKQAATVGQEAAASEPGFLSTADGQMMLLKAGLTIAKMFMAAQDKPEQKQPKPLDQKIVKKIKKKKKKKWGL